MSQINGLGEQQPFVQQPVNDQPHVQHMKQHAPDVRMETLTADDLKTIMADGASVSSAASKKRWSLAAKIITGIFTLGIAPAIMCSKEGKMERKSAQDALRLKDALKRFADDPNAERQVIHMSDKRIILDKTENGGIKAFIDRQVVEAKHTAKDMVEIIEDDIVSHVDFYGKKAASDLFGKVGDINITDKKDVLDRTGSDSRHRDLCLKALKSIVGLDPSELHSCNTRYLDRMVRYALDGYYGSLSSLLDHVLTITKTNRVAAEDAKELLDAMDRQEQENPGGVEQKVNIRAILPQKPQHTTQKQVQSMMADLIYAGNIADEDKYAGKPGERMQQVMEKNAKVIADVIITEAGVDAVKAEQKAVAAEQKAAAEDASPADKAEARALRAEANAAQYEALFLGNRLDLVPDSEKREYWIAESKAYKAEAKAIRLEAEDDPEAAEARAEANVLRAEARALRAEGAFNDLGFGAEAQTKAAARATMLEAKAELLQAREKQIVLRGQDLSRRHDALRANGEPAPASKEGRELAALNTQLEDVSAELDATRKEMEKTLAQMKSARLDVQIAEVKDKIETAEEAVRKLENEHWLAGTKAHSPTASEQDKAAFKALDEQLGKARAELSELKTQEAVLQAKARATDVLPAMEKLDKAKAALQTDGPALRNAITQAETARSDAVKKKELVNSMILGGLPPNAGEEQLQAVNAEIDAADRKLQEAQDKLAVLQRAVDEAQKEFDLASPDGQIGAAKQRTAEAEKQFSEAQAALQKAQADLATAQEGSKTNVLLLFKEGMAKMAVASAEKAAKAAEQAYVQALNDEDAIALAFAEPLPETEITFGKAGAQFDVAVPHKFSQFSDLPEGMQKSLISFDGFGEGTDALKAPLLKLKDALIEQGQPPNATVIELGLKTEEAKAMIRENAAKLDSIINTMAQGLQDEMSTMILMLDATIKPGMQTAARAIRDVLAERNLPLSKENIEQVMAEVPRPQGITDAINALAGSITGVEGDATKRRLAEKMALSTLNDFVKMDQEAVQAQQNAVQLKAEADEADRTAHRIRMNDIQKALGELQEAGDQLGNVRKEITQTRQEHAQAVADYAGKKEEVEALVLVDDNAAQLIKNELAKAAADYAERKADVESRLTQDNAWGQFLQVQQAEKNMAAKDVELRDAQGKLSQLKLALDEAKGKVPAQQQEIDAAQKQFDDQQKIVDSAREALALATEERNLALELAPDYVAESTELRYAVALAETRLETTFDQAQYQQLLQFEQDLAHKEVALLFASHDVTELGDKLAQAKQSADAVRNMPREGQALRLLEEEANAQKAYDDALKVLADAQKAFDEAKQVRTQALDKAPEYLREASAQRYSVALAEARREAAEAREAVAREAFNGASARALEAQKAENSAVERKNVLKKKADVAEIAAQTARRDADALLGIVQPEAPAGAEGAEEADDAHGAQPANAVHLTAQQKMVAELRAKDLESIAAEAALDFNSDGYGKFIKTVMLNYFQTVSMADKRSMFAAAIRYSPENADSNEMLGALLKGAGPILQKVLQGLDGPSLPPALRVAFKDMKSNLAPIPEEIIQATLLDMVERSNGKIANIEVIKSMGAASVGQALRCRITDSKGQSRECIIKILRPDAANRAAREKEIFLNAAKQVNGMEGTFKGQYDKIMEELDFSIEYANAKMGALYDSPFNGERKIQSVKVVEDIPPSSSYMAMEIAPGDTLVGFYDNTRARLAEIGMRFGADEKFDEKGVRTSVSYSASPNQRQEIIDTKNELMQLYADTKRRYDQMLALTEVWVKEGIFGEQGFFHGDLHGGNIMSDGNTLTAIDFGNATRLSTEQQSKVITMMIAAGTKQTTKFMDALRPLLTPEAQQTFDAKYDDLREALRIVMSKGGDGETGTRIGAILSVLQKYGVSIPSSLFNFSSSELRLQNSVAELASLMQEIKEDVEALDSARSLALEGTGDMYNYTNQAMEGMAQHISQQTLLNHISEGKNSADWAMELLDVPGITYDANGDFEEAGLPQEFAEGGEKAKGREMLSTVIQEFNIYAMQHSTVGAFYADNIEPFPAAKAVWDANIDNATNMELTQEQRDQAKVAIIKELLKITKDTLSQFETEINADPVYGPAPQGFFDVVNDVCRANRGAAAWKIGVVPAVKFAVFGKI